MLSFYFINYSLSKKGPTIAIISAKPKTTIAQDINEAKNLPIISKEVFVISGTINVNPKQTPNKQGKNFIISPLNIIKKFSKKSFIINSFLNNSISY